MDSCLVLSRLRSPAAHRRQKSCATIPRNELQERLSFPSFDGKSSAAPKLSNVTSGKEVMGRPTSRSWFQSLCNLLEDAVDHHFCRGNLPKSVDPEQLLVGIFAPVEELPPTTCPVVEGTVPECLRGGAYVRNGPNPRQPPAGSHHVFDGDGMLHSLLFQSDGSGAVLCSRYSRTTAPSISKIFALRGVEGAARFVITFLRILSGQIDIIEGMSTASTSVSFFWDKIFVHGEFDQPFTVHLSPETGELSSERNDIGRRLPKGSSVHYKHDQLTGELFAISYGLVPPFLTLHCYDERRNAKLRVPVWSVPRPYVFHDFAVTKNYSVIPEIQVVIDPLGMLFNNGHFIKFDPKKSARVGVIPRDATSGSEMRWFDVPGFYPLHVCNAWEERDDGEVVVLVGSCAANMEHLAERIELVHPLLEMVRIDLKEATVVRTVLSAMGLGFTAVNPTYTGKKTRYLYSGVFNQTPKISGVAKLDLELAEKRVDCIVATRDFGAEVFGGEPIWVPRGEGDHLDEDDGFLLTFVHDERRDKSKFIVMETKSPDLEVVVEVELPRRVPFGFHGAFVSQDELRRQK